MMETENARVEFGDWPKSKPVKPYYEWDYAPCHRSMWAPPTEAMKRLKSKFNGKGLRPRVTFNYKNFACSGAELKHFDKFEQQAIVPDRGYPPIINRATQKVQLQQAKEWLKKPVPKTTPTIPIARVQIS